MHDHAHRHTFCSIVPPYILEALTRERSGPERRAVQRTLLHDDRLRQRRIVTAPPREKPRPPSAVPRTPHLTRTVFDAKHRTTLPGTKVRSEGGKKSGDKAVDEAYDGTGATFKFYWDIFARDSIDDAGLPLIRSVHYGNAYDNAFWDGSQMIFGDGDGVVFNRFTVSVDVIGHELSHGITDRLAALRYQGQSGALNESMSDVFGSMVKQYTAKTRQTAADADWLIGAGLLAKGIKGVALRSMKAPGTAYDDPQLGGKDPQPATMAGYVTTTDDNGGVHLNSGIPNHAFYLAAVAFGGYAWQKAGKIWFATLADPKLRSTATFVTFANRTLANAQTLFGSDAEGTVKSAWTAVGVRTTG
jgi:Zn-dependent metalloprotease